MRSKIRKLRKVKSLVFKISKFPLLSETFVVNQIITAIKLGYDVKILTEERMHISNCGNPELYNKHKLNEKIIIEDYHVPISRAFRIIKAFGLVISNFSLLKYLIRFYKESRKEGLTPIFQFFFYKSLLNFDIIHIQFGTNKYPVDDLKKIGFLKAKVIVSFHGHDLYFPINNLIPNNGYYEKLFEVAESLVCNTPFLESKLLEIGAPKSKSKVIPVAVDTSYFKPSTINRKDLTIKLVTVGRLDELKGQEYGIAVVNKLIQSGYNVKYFIAGSGPNRLKLQRMIKNMEQDKNIVLLNKVSQDEVLKLLQRSHIFLMTSVKNSAGMEESQGLVTAEAQACGLPVVAFDSGGIKFTIRDGITGFLCKEKDLEDFVEKVMILIEDSTLRKTMGTSALNFIEKEFSENSVLRKWQLLYD